MDEKWGYRAEVEIVDGEEGQPKQVVSLIFRDRAGPSWRDEGWSNMTPKEAMDLADDLIAAAQHIEAEATAGGAPHNEKQKD